MVREDAVVTHFFFEKLLTIKYNLLDFSIVGRYPADKGVRLLEIFIHNIK